MVMECIITVIGVFNSGLGRSNGHCGKRGGRQEKKTITNALISCKALE